MSRIGQVWRDYRERRRDKVPLEIGYKIRKVIHYTTKKIYPYATIIIPSFRYAHYVYIIFMAILGSIFLYPVKNLRYIDALFFASGAATQAGLNTVNVNDITLYQQIVIYIFTTLCTPIFIHGSLLVVRLYWFERHFDNIKESSKLNYKMRRTATLAARTQSLDATLLNTVNNQGLGFNRPDIESVSPESNPSPETSSTLTKLIDNNTGRDVEHLTEPDDSETEDAIQLRDISPASPDHGDGIKFDDLPHPKYTRKQEILPSDMYRSIAMLRDNQAKNNDEDEVLIIKPPNEIENDGQKPIYTKRSQIQFNVDKGPLRKWKKSRRRFSKGNQWAKLKKSFSNTNSPMKSAKSSIDLEDDESIDSENSMDTYNGNTAIQTDSSTNLEGEDDGEEDDEGDDDDIAVTDNEENDEDNESNLDRAQSHLVIPSSDATNGHKFNKRSNTLDAPRRKNSFIKSPTFEKMISKKTRDRTKNKLKKIRTPLLRQSSSIRIDNTRSNDEESDGYSLRNVMSTNYLSWVPTVGRNSTFVHLSEEQKEELGGVEYRAVKLLIKILLAYYVGYHIIAFVFLLPWVLKMKHYMTLIRDDGVSPTWWAFFTAQSAFNDLGFTLTPDSMSSFNQNAYVLIVMSFFIVIGNTGFPIYLRLSIWLLFKVSKPLSLFKESLGFLLDHPRRCFTLLFPSIPTWWLFIVLVALNGIDLILFMVLDLNNPYLQSTPMGYRVLDGLFQAFSTRTAGFTVVNIGNLHPAVQVSYMIMMYISVLPLAISIRRTNVYEEQSLGVYLKDSDNANDDLEKTPKSFIGAHLRNQLSFDLWFVFLGLFVICIAEGLRLNEDNYNFNVFSILFEVVSAYGTVGLSLGYPNVDTSLSGQFTTISKLVIIAMMIRGRHRGLPYSLDRAIMLPDDNMQRRDRYQEDHAIRRTQTLETSPSLYDENPLRRAFTRRASTFGFAPGEVRRRFSRAQRNANESSFDNSD